MQKLLPELSVMDGCIYVSANISSYGTILQHGEILRVVYGARTPEELRMFLRLVQQVFIGRQQLETSEKKENLVKCSKL